MRKIKSTYCLGINRKNANNINIKIKFNFRMVIVFAEGYGSSVTSVHFLFEFPSKVVRTKITQYASNLDGTWIRVK